MGRTWGNPFSARPCVSERNRGVGACWNELDGIRSVEQTGKPVGWRSVERDDGVWQLRSGELELAANRGTDRDGVAGWWQTIRRDDEPIVTDYRVRVGADSDLGEALAAVLGTATRLDE